MTFILFWCPDLREKNGSIDTVNLFFFFFIFLEFSNICTELIFCQGVQIDLLRKVKMFTDIQKPHWPAKELTISKFIQYCREFIIGALLYCYSMRSIKIVTKQLAMGKPVQTVSLEQFPRTIATQNFCTLENFYLVNHFNYSS